MQPKFKLFANLLILVGLIIAQGQVNIVHATPSFRNAAPSISGRVTDGSGNGVKAVTIYATPNFSIVFLPLVLNPGGHGSSPSSLNTQSTSRSSQYSTMTDANGNYSFASLLDGPYTISVEKDGIVFTPSNRSVTLPNPTSQDFQVQILPPSISPATEVISPDTNQYLQSISSDGSQITYSQSTSELSSLAPGDILVSDPTSNAPEGYLLKVVSVTSSPGGGVVINSEPTVLEDTVEDGSIYFNRPLAPNQIAQTNALEGVRMLPSSAASPLTFSYEVKDVVMWDKDGILSTTDDQIRANGSIEFELDYEFYINFQDKILRNLTFISSTTEQDTVEISADVDLADFSFEKVLAEHKFTPFTVPIGPVPVVIVPVMEVVVGVDGSVSIGIAASVSHESTLKSGIEYINPSGWHPISEETHNISFRPPHQTVDASGRVFFGVRFGFYLYGVAGPYVKITPYAKLTVKVLENPWWKLSAGISVPAGFRASPEMQQLGKWIGVNLEEKELLAIDMEWVIAQAPTGLIWQNEPSPVFQNLNAISITPNTNGSDGWAVGDNGTFLRLNRSTWQTVNEGATNEFLSVAMVSPINGWATDVGASNQGWIWHWDGISWQKSPSNNYAFLDALSFPPGSDGSSIYSAGWWGNIWHWNGASWGILNSTDYFMLYGLKMLSDSDGWTVGGIHGQDETTGVILRWKGGSWSRVAGPNTGYWYRAVDVVSENNAWIVGNHGIILHWDGISWKIVPSPTNENLYSISMVPSTNGTDGWAVGGGGTILHWNGSAWYITVSPTLNSLRSIQMLSAAEGWAVGDNGTILHW